MGQEAPAEPIVYCNGKRYVLPQGIAETTLLQWLRGTCRKSLPCLMAVLAPCPAVQRLLSACENVRGCMSSHSQHAAQGGTAEVQVHDNPKLALRAGVLARSGRLQD